MYRTRMRWAVTVLLAAVVLSGCGAAGTDSLDDTEAPALAGQWVGRLNLGVGSRLVLLTVDADKSGYQGEVTIWGADSPVETQLDVEGDNVVTLTLQVDDARDVFRGRWEEDRIAGTVSRDSTPSEAQLFRVVELPLDGYQAYIGGYASTQDDYWFVGSTDLAGRFYLSQDEKQMGLFPLGNDQFYASTGETVTFMRDAAGAIAGLTRTAPAGRQVEASRVERYVTRPYSVENGGVALAGELLVPQGPGPFPAIVFSQGSGPETRERRRLLAEQFARRGIAAAIYDKRGTGDSGGNWYTAGFDDLASDALAIVTFVAGQPDVTADAVGLWGLSQGGWIVPLAASRSPSVAFAITVSAAGMSPDAQELYRWHHTLRDLGYAGPTLDAALKAVRLQQDLNAADLPIVDDLFLGLDFGYDPLPALRGLSQPILAIWGADDRVVPPQTSAATFRKALHLRQHPDATLRIYEGAGHSLGYAPTSDGWVSMPPTYVDTMVDWILARTVPQPELRRAATSGQITGLAAASEEIIPAPSLPWYGRAIPQLGAIGIFALAGLVTMLSWPVQRAAQALRRRDAGVAKDTWQVRLGISLAGGLGLLLIMSFFVTLGQFLMSDESALLRYSSNPFVRTFSWVVPVGMLLTGITTWRVGPRGIGPRRAGVIGAAFVGTGLLLALFLRYWELLRL